MKRFDPLVLAKYGVISPVQVKSPLFPRMELSADEFAECDRHFVQGYACLATGIYTPIGKAERVLRAHNVPKVQMHPRYRGVPWRHRS